MALDPALVKIGVNKVSPTLTAKADDPKIRKAMLLALETMDLTLQELKHSMQSLGHVLKGQGSAMGTGASKTKKNLRDQILMLVMIGGFMERAIGTQEDLERFADLARNAAVATGFAAAQHSGILPG